ncbi:hypothetical protein B0H13DRAFT_2362305 [Mycena leptocephala]|nr:hypothetical protein B0H13DRAFT_2362305 [Mycena leptocephala]
MRIGSWGQDYEGSRPTCGYHVTVVPVPTRQWRRCLGFPQFLSSCDVVSYRWGAVPRFTWIYYVHVAHSIFDLRHADLRSRTTSRRPTQSNPRRRPTQSDHVAQTYTVGPTSRRPTQSDHVAQTYAVGPRRADLRSPTTSRRPTQPELRRADLRSRTYVAQNYAAGPTSRRPMQPDMSARRDKGQEKRFVLSRASTHDEKGAGRCASCSPVSRRYNGREMRFVLSRASTIQGPGAAPHALPCLDADE